MGWWECMHPMKTLLYKSVEPDAAQATHPVEKVVAVIVVTDMLVMITVLLSHFLSCLYAL